MKAVSVSPRGGFIASVRKGKANLGAAIFLGARNSGMRVGGDEGRVLCVEVVRGIFHSQTTIK